MTLCSITFLCLNQQTPFAPQFLHEFSRNLHQIWLLCALWIACVASVSSERKAIFRFSVRARIRASAKKEKEGGGEERGRKRLGTDPAILKLSFTHERRFLIGAVRIFDWHLSISCCDLFHDCPQNSWLRGWLRVLSKEWRIKRLVPLPIEDFVKIWKKSSSFLFSSSDSLSSFSVGFYDSGMLYFSFLNATKSSPFGNLHSRFLTNSRKQNISLLTALPGRFKPHASFVCLHGFVTAAFQFVNICHRVKSFVNSKVGGFQNRGVCLQAFPFSLIPPPPPHPPHTHTALFCVRPISRWKRLLRRLPYEGRFIIDK